MGYPTNSWSILPAGQCLFGKSKVTLEDVAKEWGGRGSGGTVVICKKPNGQFHFISGASGSYSEIGKLRNVHHDQTLAKIGTWEVVNEVSYKLVDGVPQFEYKVPPVVGINTVAKAGLHVFK